MSKKTELKRISADIEKTKGKIAALRKELRTLENREIRLQKEAAKAADADKHKLGLQMMKKAVKGMTAAEIAKELGVSKHTLPTAIRSAWHKEFRNHYFASSNKILSQGLLTALRNSPPPLLTSHHYG